MVAPSPLVAPMRGSAGGGVPRIVAKACLPRSWNWEPMAGAWHPDTLSLVSLV